MRNRKKRRRRRLRPTSLRLRLIAKPQTTTTATTKTSTCQSDALASGGSWNDDRKEGKECRHFDALFKRSSHHVQSLGGWQLTVLLLLSLSLLLLFILGCAGSSPQPPGGKSISIQTRGQGQFRGLILEPAANEAGAGDENEAESPEVAAFLGIRYASAPIKRLRFMPPTAYRYAANQLHDMQQFGPICIQRSPADYLSHSPPLTSASGAEVNHSQENQNRNQQQQQWKMGTKMRLVAELMPRASFAYLNPLLERLSRRQQSEDCLNLNVYAPIEAIRSRPNHGEKAANKLPVLVIVHGESFDFGSGSAINALKFVQQTQLLAVTFNYRLNIFGFPPRLAGASRGNLGLMDQVAALHWIKDNIESFGGSANNITLLGSKKAAAFVNLLMLSPLAKGLFHRAIMEDGSALSPIVANHIVGSSQHSTGQSMTQTQAMASLPAVQHVRLLAKLCDCPIYLRQAAAANRPSQNVTAMPAKVAGTLSTGSGGSSTHQRQQLANFADETKTNALTFECLRQKPVELIMQRLPLDLLRLDSSGQRPVSMAAKWLRSLPLPLQLESLSSASSSASSSPLSTTADSTADEQVEVDLKLVSRLVSSAGELDLRRSVGAPNGEQQLDTGDGGEEEERRQINMELVNAIYGAPSTSARSIFGPVLDGIIVPDDEDLASLMLNTRSTSQFHQRDLLIGLSHSSMFESAPEAAERKLQINIDNPIYERLTAQIERFGLTNEQAIELVNVFVRSFYKYHNQEIMNSIVNHYLSSIKTRPDQSPSHHYNQTELIIERQLLVLDALVQSFQDSLISVPVIKTALIHATKQMDTLVDAFVGQQFDKWKRKQQQQQLGSSAGSDDDSTNPLMDAFTNFAKTLMSDTNWPLELHAPNEHNFSNQASTIIQQPRATYLYQLDSSALVRLTKRVADRLPFGANSRGWQLLHETLVKIHSGLHSKPETLVRLSLACGLELYEDDQSRFDVDDSLIGQLIDRVCSRFNKLIKTFVVSGHMKVGEDKVQQPISEHIARFEQECLYKNQPIEVLTDHDLVQSAAQSNSSDLDEKCRSNLHRIALNYIESELRPPTTNDHWPVFNVFTQQLATLPGSDAAQLWQTRQVSERGADSALSVDEKSSLVARASFWSNFIPALNCTRTLPVMPSSLLISSSPLSNLASNQSVYSLLSLNLQFGCQQGAKTALTLIESLAKTIEQKFQDLKTFWSTNRRLESAQNHHTRMANMSQSVVEENLMPDQRQFNDVNANFDDFNRTPTLPGETHLQSPSTNDFNSSTSGPIDTNFLRRFLVNRRLPLPMLALGGIIVSLTVIMAAYAIKSRCKTSPSSQEKHLNCNQLATIEFEHQQHQRDDIMINNLQSSLSEDASDLMMMRAQQPQLINSGELLVHNDSEVSDLTTTQQANDINSSLQHQFHPILKDTKEQQPPKSIRQTCSVTTDPMSQLNENSLNYWDNPIAGAGNDQLNTNQVLLCRSHSSLNTASSTVLPDQPIMMPILHQHTGSLSRHQQLDINNQQAYHTHHTLNHYHQHSCGEATSSKKRVKISDPLGTMRAASAQCPVHSHRQNEQQQQHQHQEAADYYGSLIIAHQGHDQASYVPYTHGQQFATDLATGGVVAITTTEGNYENGPITYYSGPAQ